MFDAFYAAHLLNATGIIVVPGSSFGQEYFLYMDVPGLSKSDIQFILKFFAIYSGDSGRGELIVVKSNGKRKHGKKDEEEEGCKYLLLERRPQKNLMRKFRLPENCNMSAISAKCENGVLKMVVEKLPPPKSKTI
ncbi:17.4 kDa class III heat shock protein [Artemisia annua]|uniref:17.4 kDa class III heat shock protein n=1 Tax=Artemisia annua TaxID=35608 RepID=A0A2U1NF67_ARTAN|nr:17.4 kDa class III heat shock protein [Artemisia annua]